MAFCAYCGTQLAEVSYAPCPNCGNPSNGAPRGSVAPPVPGSSGSKTAIIVVVLVVGGFFLIAIIGILAAIAIPNMTMAKNRASQKRTMADLRSIATACEAYATDKNQYPNATSVEGLRPLLSPTYMRDVPLKDGWGTDFRYEAWSRANELDSYAVGSAGKDKKFDHDVLHEYGETPSSTTQFDCDIVFSNGNFVQYPDLQGVQR
jgi:type II secretory pathway pseudopilin PulG